MSQNINVTIPIFQLKIGNWIEWTTLGLGHLTKVKDGKSTIKIQQGLVDELKRDIREMEPAQLEILRMSRGIRLQRARLDLSLRGEGGKRKVTGIYPLILEPRWMSDERRITVVYHPSRQLAWFALGDEDRLEEQAAIFFAKNWVDLDEEDLDDLESSGKERIRSISFIAESKSLLDLLPDRQKGIWDDLIADPRKKKKSQRRGGLTVLPDIGVDQTARAADHSLPIGMPRSPYREHLQMLLGGDRPSPTLLVGPPGVGKRTIVYHWIHDRLAADDFEAHRNLDRVHHVWSVAGKRIIAGMSYLGDWEKRCVDLVKDVAGKKIVLLVEDIAAFGRIGRSRESDRNLAEFFRGPVARGEVMIVGALTLEQMQRLEDDAPSFASLFTLLRVDDTDPSQTLRMMMHEGRSLEQKHTIALSPFAYRAVIELGGSLFSGSSFPGKALELLRELAKHARRRLAPEAKAGERLELTPLHVIRLLASKTGLPELLLKNEEPLSDAELLREFSRHVIGQRDAIESAVDLIVRIRAGMTDAGRPFAVYLVTGPTGTGKTELAKCIAEYLYGERSRLLRLDMSEFSASDAAARLIGDRFEPQGLLTRAIRQQPFCVLLLDEIEKAHPSVFNLLLQLFDEGRLTDANGETADFTHAVVLMTSNLGARSQSAPGFGDSAAQLTATIPKAVEEFFPPELFNRIDRVVPFSALDERAARAIVEKEISKLLGRWGLTERNIFVYCSAAALDRIVARGFDPFYGARTVKRFLEDNVATLLAEEITSSKPAAMRVIRLLCAPPGSSLPFRLHVESLTEVEPKENPSYAIAGLSDLSPAELKRGLPQLMDQMDALIASEDVLGLEERRSYHLAQHNQGEPGQADLLYYTESMQTELRRLRGRVGHHLARKAPDRDAMLRCFAELPFYRRALKKIGELDQHAAVITLMGVGLARHQPRFRRQSAGLLESLAQAIGASETLSLGEVVGELDSFSARLPDGTLVDRLDASEAELLRVLEGRPDLLVLKVVGLCVLDYFTGEDGCHIWKSLAHGTEVIRVRVKAAPANESVADLMRAHLRAVDAFALALESDAADLPQNPEGLLPAVREIQFTPPADATIKAPLMVEDYGLTHAETTRVRKVAELLPALWTLRMSRID